MENMKKFDFDSFLPPELLIPTPSQIVRENGNLGKTDNLANYAWITVNPKLDITLPDFVKVIHKMYSKKWITNSLYIFEIGKNGHQHSHGLIKFNYRRDKVVKELKNSCKNICNVEINNCFCLRFLTDEDQVVQKIRYMQGLKQDSKVDAVEESKKWRTEHSLEEFYGDPNLVSPLNHPVI